MILSEGVLIVLVHILCIGLSFLSCKIINYLGFLMLIPNESYPVPFLA